MIQTKNDVEAYISAYWKNALEQEGFGRYNIYETKAKDVLSVQDELDALSYYQKIASFFFRTEFDLNVRHAFIREYALPYFDAKKLDEKTTIPTLSFIPKALRNICMLYSMGVSRSIEGDESAMDKLDKFISQAELNRSSIDEYRLTKLCGVVSIRFDFDTPSQKLFIDVRTPNEFRVQYNDKGEVEKYCWQTMRTIKGAPQPCIEVYTADRHYLRDTTGMPFSIDPTTGEGVAWNDELNVNQYGYIPVVFWHSDKSGFYASDMHDLVESCIRENYGRMLRDIDQTFAAINMLLMVNTGVGDSPEMQQLETGRTDKGEISVDVGMRTAVVVENVGAEKSAPTVDIIAGTPHSEVLTANMESEKREALINEGLSTSFFTDQTRELSGRAIKAEKEELILIRDTDKTVFTEFERAKMAMLAKVLNFYTSVKLPEEPEAYTIDYVEEQYDDVDPVKDLEYDKARLEMGAIDVLTFMKKHNTDVDTEDEAVKLMQKNKAVYAKVRTVDLDLQSNGEPINPEDAGGTNQIRNTQPNRTEQNGETTNR